MLFLIGDMVTLRDGTVGYVKKMKHPGGDTMLIVPIKNGSGEFARIVTARDIVGKYGTLRSGD